MPKTIRELLIAELHDMLDAETQLTKALPKLVKAANSEELVTAFTDHLRQTEGHVKRLKQVMETLGEMPKRKTCKAMAGLLEEGQELMNADGPPNVKDQALIAAAQKVEHYEMATYGCLRTWARLLDEPEAADMLQETLDEEHEADKLLTRIAESLTPEMDESDDDEDEERVTVKSARSGGTSAVAHRAPHSKKRS